jgi:hypothetical protein
MSGFSARRNYRLVQALAHVLDEIAGRPFRQTCDHQRVEPA